ncbi:hypothetical protein B0H14DRAFT_2740723 [Mycena olivaceomarginata]|nr:hypothetical protein B0H14DRAFT_2740723 [Mycena olivaceomarginata]
MANRRKMSDTFDMPLDSSPLRAPSPVRTVPPGGAAQSPQSPGSPSPLQAPVVPRLKRPAEDMSQFAGEVSRAHKLKKEDHEALIGFLQYLGRGEQLVSLAGQLLAIAHRQSLIQPAAKEWKVPKKLMDKLTTQAGPLMVDPSIPAYRDTKIGPTKLLTDMVLVNPSWGFGTELRDEKHAMDALGTAVSGVLTSRRNLVKNTILGSLGSEPEDPNISVLRPDALNIVDLAQAIIVKLKVKSVPLDIRMCGRIAILRQLVSEGDDTKYWTNVDKQLAGIRASHPDPAKQSKWIKKYVLDPDFQTYGTVDLTSLATGASVHVGRPSTAPPAAADADTSGNNDEDA